MSKELQQEFKRTWGFVPSFWAGIGSVFGVFDDIKVPKPPDDIMAHADAQIKADERAIMGDSMAVLIRAYP